MSRVVKVNLKGFQELEKSLSNIQENADAFIKGLSKELAARLLSKVIRRTPVGKKPFGKDTKKTVKIKTSKGNRSYLTKEGAILEQYWSGYQGGTLRRGWTGGKKQKVSEYIKDLKVNKNGEVYEIVIQNNVEYATYVEFGHRQTPGRYVPALGKKLKKGWVPGQFMLTISEQELEGELPKIIERKIKNFLNGGGK